MVHLRVNGCGLNHNKSFHEEVKNNIDCIHELLVNAYWIEDIREVNLLIKEKFI